MALTAPLLYQSLLASRLSGVFPFGGVAYDSFAIGLANGVDQWAHVPVNLALAGVSTGQSGTGTIGVPASRITVPPNTGLLVSALSGAGMQGPLSLSLASSVAAGIATGFSLYAQYTGVSVGVGVGADVSKVVLANAATLVGILEVTLRASMGPGLALSMMSLGLGNGIASLLLLGVGAAPVVGSTTPPYNTTVGATTSMVV